MSQRPPDGVPAEVAIDAATVGRLLRDQHPDLAELPVRFLAEGWDNTLFRVGDRLIARMPRRALGAQWLEKELRLLPSLAPRLPVAVPAALRSGEPDDVYPYRWALTPFFEGEVAGRSAPAGAALAQDLDHFLVALHQPAGVQVADNTFRAVHPSARDGGVRGRIEGLPVDAAAVLAVWADASAAPAWSGPALWCHADLHPFNVLLREGHLAAVLDWGDLHIGDPAPDLASLWMLFDVEFHRPILDRYDADTRRRGLAWAVFFGVMLADAGQRGAGSDFLRVGLATLGRTLHEG